MRRLNRLLGGATVVLLAAAGIGFVLFRSWLAQPFGPAAAGYVLDVPPGSSVQTVARQLAEDGLLTHPRWLEFQARLAGQATRIRAGEYELSAETTPTGLLDQLVSGRVRLHSLTIVEGWTVYQLLDALRRNMQLVHELHSDGPVELARELQLDFPHAEGLFFPDTYRFPKGTRDIDLLRQAHEQMRQRLDAAWRSRQAGLPLKTPYEALILAAIVERETALDSERPMIAGVFIRRLQRHMRLQTDPTVIYGLGMEFDGNLTRADLESDTPYNTYTRHGLPPTPIALPGRASLEAAVHPASGDALYFVATGKPDGSHTFSSTLQEHNAAVARYLAELRRQRQGD